MEATMIGLIIGFRLFSGRKGFLQGGELLKKHVIQGKSDYQENPFFKCHQRGVWLVV